MCSHSPRSQAPGGFLRAPRGVNREQVDVIRCEWFSIVAGLLFNYFASEWCWVPMLDHLWDIYLYYYASSTVTLDVFWDGVLLRNYYLKNYCYISEYCCCNQNKITMTGLTTSWVDKSLLRPQWLCRAKSVQWNGSKGLRSGDSHQGFMVHSNNQKFPLSQFSHLNVLQVRNE